MRHNHLTLHIAHSADQSALAYLEDIWVEHDQLEPRAFKLEFVGAIRLCTGDTVLDASLL